MVLYYYGNSNYWNESQNVRDNILSLSISRTKYWINQHIYCFWPRTFFHFPSLIFALQLVIARWSLYRDRLWLREYSRKFSRLLHNDLIFIFEYFWSCCERKKFKMCSGAEHILIPFFDLIVEIVKKTWKFQYQQWYVYSMYLKVSCLIDDFLKFPTAKISETIEI